jgi:hypothetical protein
MNKIFLRFMERQGMQRLILTSVFAVLPFLLVAALDTSYKETQGSSRYSSGRSSGISSTYDSGIGSNTGRNVFGSRRTSSTRSDSDKNATTKNENVRNRDKTREKASNQPGAKGAKATPKEEKTLKGKKPPAKKSATGSGQARPSTTVEFKIRPSPSANILAVETSDLVPTMHATVEMGQSLVTRVVFRNGQQAKLDAVELALRFDPKYLQLEGIDDSSIASSLSEPAKAEIDSSHGLIVYKARFAAPRKDDFLVLFKIQWKTLAPTEHTAIEFVNTEKFPSRVLDGTKNLLTVVASPEATEDDTEESQMDQSSRMGLLGADIAIAPTAELLEQMRDEETPLTGIELARKIAEGSAEGGIKLALQPRTRTVKVGDTFLVDVVYENPNRVEIDSVKLSVRFDPRVLQVVDYDENNWITKGINAFDGDYHEELPFDFHIRDVAYNSTGLVLYQMGFSGKTVIPQQGTLLTIKFEAVAPADSTRIEFDFDDTQKSPPTSISFLGFNLIGIPGDRQSALQNCAIHIAPHE